MFDIKKIVKKGDYLYAVCPEHPNSSKHGYVLHHRVVMENHLGRTLSRGEIVHHKNHDKKDNRLDNLELMTVSEHAKHHARDRPRKMLRLTCPYCHTEFDRPANLVSGRARAFCSRSCNARATRASGKWLGKQKK